MSTWPKRTGLRREMRRTEAEFDVLTSPRDGLPGACDWREASGGGSRQG